MGTVTVGKHPRRKTTNPKWIVVSGKSAFNAFIGRSTLQELRAITSMQYVKTKFPTDQGVGEAQGTQALARSCYADFFKTSQDKQCHKVTLVSTNLDPCLPRREAISPRDDVEEVAPDLEQPEKNFKVEKYHELGTKKKLSIYYLVT